MNVSFHIPGQPSGKGRPRFARRGAFVATYTDSKTASYENLVKLAASQAMGGRDLIDVPVSVVVGMYHQIPKSWSKKKKNGALSGAILPAVKCDMDNCIKAVFDALNGVVWVDDVQVVELKSIKRYDNIPRVEVTVSYAQVEVTAL